jgi:hypothetical protein
VGHEAYDPHVPGRERMARLSDEEISDRLSDWRRDGYQIVRVF